MFHVSSQAAFMTYGSDGSGGPCWVSLRSDAPADTPPPHHPQPSHHILICPPAAHQAPLTPPLASPLAPCVLNTAALA